jgi:hypothetical protein
MTKVNAFDMFKTSGNMRLVDNKELLLSIWDTYSILAETKQIFDTTTQMKLEEMKKYFYLNSMPDEELLINPPMYDFYVNMYAPYVLKRLYERAIAMLNETLSKFQ